MNSRIEQLTQLTTVTWDGHLISKPDRDALIKLGYAVHSERGGFQVITPRGINLLSDMNLLRDTPRPCREKDNADEPAGAEPDYRALLKDSL